MEKKRIEKLIPIADKVLQEQRNSGRDSILKNNNTIKKNYDGKVSGFGIAVALSGLRPTLAMYFNESSDVRTRPILDAIAGIIEKDEVYRFFSKLTNSESLLQHALDDDTDLKELKKYVLEASIALKQIVRTYELV